MISILVLLATWTPANCSTYVVYIPLDSPIYTQLDTLNSLGFLDTYLEELKPISRVEAARLVLEAQKGLSTESAEPGVGASIPLARAMVRQLRAELPEEIGWLENDNEDMLPAMVRPVDRLEAQYVYSTGRRRSFGPVDRQNEELYAQEATPLLPNNDGIPTSAGSNETMRASGWLGAGGFFTGYGEIDMSGPFTHSPPGFTGATTNRFQLLRGEVVTDFGNTAISFGLHEMYWGTGYFGSLSQGNNAPVFPALRIASVHPSYLPGFLGYLGPFRAEAFFGQLDHGRDYSIPSRIYSRPWISGQVIVFKPLPTYEFGITHVIEFGGLGNTGYSWMGFLGRATGLSTGNSASGNTNSQAGFTNRFYFPSLRNSYLYVDALGEDNLTLEVPKIGGLLPFAAVSYKGGFYVPRLTSDGRTSARFEFTNTSQRYGFHHDSLYWAYKNRLMGDPIGPNAFEADLALDRWVTPALRLNCTVFHGERDPELNGMGAQTEHSDGMSLGFMRVPERSFGLRDNLIGMNGRVGFEYARNLNTIRSLNSVRGVVQLSFTMIPTYPSLTLEKGKWPF